MTQTTYGSYYMWSLKDIRSHEAFDGSKENFESYFFSVEAEVSEMGWKLLFDSAVTHVGPIDPLNITNLEIREIDRNLSTLLAMKMRGRA